MSIRSNELARWDNAASGVQSLDGSRRDLAKISPRYRQQYTTKEIDFLGKQLNERKPFQFEASFENTSKSFKVLNNKMMFRFWKAELKKRFVKIIFVGDLLLKRQQTESQDFNWTFRQTSSLS